MNMIMNTNTKKLDRDGGEVAPKPTTATAAVAAAGTGGDGSEPLLLSANRKLETRIRNSHRLHSRSGEEELKSQFVCDR